MPEEASSWVWSLKRQGSSVARLDTGPKEVQDLDLLENESLVNPKVGAELAWRICMSFYKFLWVGSEAWGNQSQAGHRPEGSAGTGLKKIKMLLTCMSEQS